jgi:hypothetical protein
MAAITPTAGTEGFEYIGTKRVHRGNFAAPSDGDTWTTGLTKVEYVRLTFNDAATVAADSMAYTASGGTVTFETAGTGRAFSCEAIGY